MKTLLLLITITLSSWANGSFYDLYAQNRATNKPNLITADFIASAYANYKLSREQKIEERVLKPRVLNFVNYLYKGVLEMNIPNKEQTVAYVGVLSLLAKNGQNLILPDSYKHLASRIGEEANLVMSANTIALSPVMQVRIDYRKFKVPNRYRSHRAYYRTLKYAQTIEFNEALAHNIRETLNDSERLSNLNRHIKEILSQFIGVEKKSNTLFSTYRGLAYHIFDRSKKESLNTIINAIKNDPFTKKRLLNLYSSYDYDFKIMQTLLKNGHTSAFKGYYTQSQYRNMLYRTQYKNNFKTKAMHKESRTKANMELKLEETLSVMIEGALVFANTLRKNEKDKYMITTLKELRTITQKKSMGIKLTALDMKFLNQLDLIFLEITGVKDRPMSIGKNKLLAPKAVGFGDGSWGARFVHREM